MAKNLEISFLLDFYGDMLTDKQRDVVELYYNEDLSLAEIAAHSGITRQGVRDSIKRAEGQLRQQGDIGAGEIVFPFADGLRGDAEFGGEFFLGHILFAAQLRDAAAESLIHHNNVTSKCCVMFGVGAPFHD